MEHSDLRAVIDDKKCYASGACIKVCQVQAIKEGPKQLPLNLCHGTEFLPGKAILDPEICNGCGDCVAVCSNHAISMEAS
jgi:NAD-dependent dihydropyrimidine dehydrogenase PreA subunit